MSSLPTPTDDGPSRKVDAILWCGGTPSTGAIPPPLQAVADTLGLPIASWPRPGYAGRPREPGRTFASGVGDAVAALDRLGSRCAVAVGYSGGGPHALAIAARLGQRVPGVLAIASPAPHEVFCQPGSKSGFDTDAWTAGMASPQALLAAIQGRPAREALALTEEFDPSQFVASDWAALSGPWAAVGQDAQAATAAAPRRGDGSPGVPDGQVDDDLAIVGPWGFDLAQLDATQVVLMHGTDDRVIPLAHAEALANTIPHARFKCTEGAGHVAVLLGAPEMLVQLVQLVEKES